MVTHLPGAPYVVRPARPRSYLDFEKYTQYGPIKNGRIKNQGSDFEKK